MTASELSYSFDIYFDSIAGFTSPGFTNREKSEILSQAQENIYLDLIDPQTVQRSTATKDELGKIILAELIRNSGNITVKPNNDGTLPSNLKNLPNGQFVYLPIDFFFPLTEFVDIEFLSTSYYYNFTTKYPSHIKTNVSVKPISQLEVNSEFYSPIRKPYEDLVWRLEYGRTTPTAKIGTDNTKVYELIGASDYKINNYKATYYRRLQDISIDNNTTSELDPFIHRTIVKDAIKIAAAAINNPNKYQIANAEAKQ